jgi:hypothetical protein
VAPDDVTLDEPNPVGAAGTAVTAFELAELGEVPPPLVAVSEKV